MGLAGNIQKYCNAVSVYGIMNVFAVIGERIIIKRLMESKVRASLEK